MSFLDSSKAFDTVWRHGLLLKLYNLGVTNKLWSLINDCHNNNSSSIVGLTYFKVSNKVVSSLRFCTYCLFLLLLVTYSLLVFINELIDTLQQSSMCTKLLNVASNCPSLADDISLVALTPNSLQDMLNVADRYSKKWRFKFNANKSCILRFRCESSICVDPWRHSRTPPGLLLSSGNHHK